MNIRPVLKKLFRVVLTAFLYLLFFLFCYYLLKIIPGIRHPAPAVFISLVVSLYFHEEITWKVRNFIDKNFYHKIFVISQSLSEFNVKLNSIMEYRLLVQEFCSFLKNTFTGHCWAFYLSYGEKYELMDSGQIDTRLPQLISLASEKMQTDISKRQIDFLELHKAKIEQPALAVIPETDELYYFFPLQSYQGSIGFLLFDRKFAYYLHFRSLKKQLVHIFNKTADVLENDLLYSEVKRKSLQNHLLLEIGRKISATLHLNEVLETIVDSMKQLVSYDAAGIFLIDREQNVLRRQVTRGYDENLLDKLLLKVDQGSYGWVIQNKKMRVTNDVQKDELYYQVRSSTRSQVTIPLLNGSQAIGVMALESDRLNHFTPMDVELLETFASQAVVAIENAQLYEESLQKKRLESELIVASKVQKALMPERPPCLPGFKTSFLTIPSRYVGGDFFDIFRTGESELGIAIGDVSGKGAPASILMAVLYAGFKSLLKEIYPVVEVVARLNNLMTETTAQGYYVTFFFGVINKETRQFTSTNAGHNPPILLHKDLSVKRLTSGGIVLGFLADQEYHQEEVTLESGDYLVLFTDGVTEVKNSLGEEFGDERLIDFLRKHYGEKPTKLRTLLLQEVRNFCAQKDLPDDLTLAIVYAE